MTYSHSKPTKPGWYWCRTTEPWEAVVRVDFQGEILFCTWLTAPGYAAILFEQDWLPKTLWAGPIKPPNKAKKP